MGEIITRYVRILIGFALIWGVMTVWNMMGCREVHGAEMEPTIAKENFKVIWAKKFRPYEHVGYDDFVYYEYSIPGQGQEQFAARVIGLPGDRIKIDKGDVYRDGGKLDRAYVGQANVLADSYEEIIVPRDSFFVLMDNRRHGQRLDSRGVGPIGQYAVVGTIRH